MKKEEVKEKMAFAKDCVEYENEFKKEAYTAILTASLLSEQSMQKMQVVQNATQTNIKLNKPISAKEFLLQKQPKTNIEKAVCLAYYYEHNKGITAWAVKDVVDWFRDAKETVPVNPSDVIFKCRGKGWVMEVEEGYTITNMGEKMVESNFQTSD